ncbi:UNVERIFIED_CONTAM: hypothetical protein Sradi_6206100 [Sesamum radiatum]|uniref:Uncharacterized protein n=1 Tax=Sesamum radiatum TaxID=300843 RepID=A0AAW2K8U9_SESRA
MNDFSTVDGFVEISEDLADMIKFVANEPSVGLFYIQQHTQNAAPNIINLKNNIVEKSHETALHTEDLEDSITMDNDKSTGYLSSVLKSAKQTANNFKWPEVEPREASQSKGENISSDHAPPFLSAISGPTPPTPEAETEDLPLSSEVGRELQEESQLSKSMSHQQFLSLYENYDEFKADQEAKLEEWLGGTGNDKDHAGKNIAR